MPTTDGTLLSGKRLIAELEALNQVSDLAGRLHKMSDVTAALSEVLDAALQLLGASTGYVRLRQEKTGVLELVAQRGIRNELLDYFRAANTDEGMLCEKALHRRERVVVEDVQCGMSFGCFYRKIAASAGYRALQASPLIDNNGAPIAVLCTHFRQAQRPHADALRMLDLYLHQASEAIGRMRAEKTARDRDAQFRALADAAPVLAWQLDANGNAVYMNRRYLELTGRREYELLQYGWQTIIHPDDAPACLASLARARREQSCLQQRIRLRCRDGWHVFESHAQPWFDAEDCYAGHIVVSIDVTDAVQAEQTRTAYRMATEGGNEGFFILRPVYGDNNAIIDFAFIDSNQCGAASLGYEREELIGKKISVLYAAGDRLERPMKILHRALELGFFEDELEVSHDGPLHHHWIHCKIVRSQGDLAITLRDISATKAHVDELERRGNEDALTGLRNRHWLQDYLPGALGRAAEDASELALLFMDLDGFKQVNDRFGHPAGDELLRAAAHRLKVAVRPQDKVARLGGDEFIVILENLARRADAAQVATRILHAFGEDFMLSRGRCSVGTSIGISLFPADAKDAETLLSHADMAMYEVKSTGKRNYRFFTPQCEAHAHLV